MAKHLVYGSGALLLCVGCINSKFHKTGWNVVMESVGLGLMTIAYMM